jgi:molybdate transport system substrate-binding protein
MIAVRLVGALMLGSGLLGACQLSLGGSPSATPVSLNVFAAASLTNALDAVKAAYEATDAGLTLTIATDSSAALRVQIEQGAPADVFLSADASNPQALVDAGTAADPITPFAANTVALVVPADNPAAIRSPADLATPGLAIVAAGSAVPISRYAAEVLDLLAQLPGYPTDFPARYATNVVSEEDNVRAVLTKIESGDGDVGFVYRTDALASTSVQEIQIPVEAQVAATYEGCVIAASAHLTEATAFLAWLAGSDGQAILSEFGFGAP